MVQPMIGIWAMAGMALGLLWQQYMAGDIEPPRGELTVTNQWGDRWQPEEHIISRRSSRKVPNLLNQSVFERELETFFQSVIQNKETLTRVSRAKPGLDKNLAYVPVYWFFDDGEVKGVGFNVHVNRHGDLSPGNSWIVGVDDMAADSYALTAVNFDQVINRITGSFLAGDFTREAGYARKSEEDKHRRSNDKWSKLGEKRGIKNDSSS